VRQSVIRLGNGSSSILRRSWYRRPARVPAFRVCAPGRAHPLGGESPLHGRQGEVLAERQRCPSRDGIGRKLKAKRWPDEQEGDRGPTAVARWRRAEPETRGQDSRPRCEPIKQKRTRVRPTPAKAGGTCWDRAWVPRPLGGCWANETGSVTADGSRGGTQQHAVCL
jgi:hypothetical protein